MVKGTLRRCGVVGAAGAGLLLALAGCDANQDFDVAKLLAPPPATGAAAARDLSSPEAVATSPPPQLARFRNLRAADVEALVGSPDFRRVEPPGELWQYRTAACVVDIFFYGKGDDRRVTQVYGRGRDPARTDDRRCGDGSDVLKNRLRVSSR